MAQLPSIIAAAIRTIPEIDGALCAGRSPLHDLDVHGEPDEIREARHFRAAALCARCPVTDQCRSTAQNLGARAAGVWAGEIRDPKGRRT